MAVSSRSVLVVFAALVATGLASAIPTNAVEPSRVAHGAVVNTTPATWTPDVKDGTVFAIGQVGSKMVLGGKFTTVKQNGGGTLYTRNNVLAFDASNGTIDMGFVPTLDGEVNAVIPGDDNTVYLAGKFKTVNGVNMRVAKLDATTGEIVSGWKPPSFSAATTSLVLSGGRLFVGGSFIKAGSVPQGGLVALDPTTGALSSYVQVKLTGHHGKGSAVGAVGVKKLDIDPSGTSMVVIGNFTSATDGSGSYARDQVVRLNLGGAATVDPTWATLAYTAQCFNGSFDSYVRDLQFSPDGSYFVIVTTGGSGTNTDGTNSSCDTTARFETAGSGSNVRPTWLDYTGQDSLWSVAVTGTAVYVGGHQRWLNNSRGRDAAGAGAVPRPGLGALDPLTGVPLSWNPGRNPRGVGAFAILATPSGLWVGSDTNWIGNFQYKRMRIAFFPLEGGSQPASDAVGRLPGNVYQAGGFIPALTDTLSYRHVDATNAIGASATVDNTNPWSQVRGAFMLNGWLYYGKSDSNLYRRTFDGLNLGAENLIDPYNDPLWSTVGTGSGQTYRGAKSGLYAQLPSVTSMFFTNGRIYYTLTNDSRLHYRFFGSDAGIVGSDEFLLSDSVDWKQVAGAFISGSNLYYATKSDGVLRSVAWNGEQASGPSVVIDSTNNWATRGLFLIADPA